MNWPLDPADADLRLLFKSLHFIRILKLGLSQDQKLVFNEKIYIYLSILTTHCERPDIYQSSQVPIMFRPLICGMSF
jgi:hypothetical protein